MTACKCISSALQSSVKGTFPDAPPVELLNISCRMLEEGGFGPPAQRSCLRVRVLRGCLLLPCIPAHYAYTVKDTDTAGVSMGRHHALAHAPARVGGGPLAWPFTATKKQATGA